MPTRHIIDMDLSRIGERERQATWRRWTEEKFANVEVVDLHGGPLEGYIRGVEIGHGRLVKIYSAGRRIARKAVPADEPAVTVLAQLSGLTTIERAGQGHVLTPGDICIIDGASEFDQQHSPASTFIMLQLQRSLALARRAQLVLTPITVYRSEQPAVILLRGALESAFETAPQLSQAQRELLCQVLFDLASLLSEGEDDGLGPDQRRRRDALVLIEEALGDKNFTATALAARLGISRRRLDEIFVKHVGRTVVSYIWERRLARASDMLRDVRHAAHTITEIAFEVGFEDSSHFSRTFRARFGVSPREWRNRAHAAPADASLSQQ